MRSPSDYVESAWAHGKISEMRQGRAMMTEWALAEKVSPYVGRGRHCLGKLLNYKHRCTSMACYYQDERSPNRFHALDHQEWWRDQKEHFVVTAHPYGCYEVRMLMDWCNEHQLDLRIPTPEQSWYYPTVTNLIVVKGRWSPSAAPILNDCRRHQQW